MKHKKDCKLFDNLPDIKDDIEICIHCGQKCKPSEGQVCTECYSEYTPGMLSDLEG